METTVQATTPTLDVESLLNPIPGGSPAGISLRYEAVYDALKEARRSDEELPQGEWVGKTKSADWELVVKLASETLSAKSKDLQVGVWLTEALLILHGFAGLRDGLMLIKGLHDRYWDTYFPQIEDGEVDRRCAPLEWLNKKVPLSVRAIDVTGRRGGDNYSWLRWEESRAVENLARTKPEAAQAAWDEGRLSAESFDKAVTATAGIFYEQLWSDVKAAQDAVEALDLAVDQRFGHQAPSLNELKKAVEDCAALAETLLRKKRSPMPNPIADGQGVADMEHEHEGGVSLEAVSFDGAPATRAEALKRLAGVAAYFRRTEPHSPVSYLVQRAVQWGNMSLEQWLRDVINSEDELMRVKETLGLKAKNE